MRSAFDHWTAKVAGKAASRRAFSGSLGANQHYILGKEIIKCRTLAARQIGWIRRRMAIQPISVPEVPFAKIEDAQVGEWAQRFGGVENKQT